MAHLTRRDLLKMFRSVTRDAEPREQLDRDRRVQRGCACRRPVPSGVYLGEVMCRCQCLIEQ